jgi:phytoene dehydrogenase-like protein
MAAVGIEHVPMGPISRRRMLAGLLGGTASLIAGCTAREHPLPPAGEILSPDFSIGHRIRDGFRPRPAADRWQEVDAVIVGGGISGLAAAWCLKRAGLEKFVVLELEGVPGGTARSGRSPVTAYPWGAHYVPVPFRENRSLIALLREMGVIEGFDASGELIVGEQYLCRDPGERIFMDGAWCESLFPLDNATDRDRTAMSDFRAELAYLADGRDAQGRRPFAIPVATGSDHADITSLDAVSMADWMRDCGFDSTRLRWLVDYSCRDDYGSTIEETSAWAGVFYFASRLRTPNSDAQPIITWPEGNGRIVRHLSDRVAGQLRCGTACLEIATTHPRGKQSGAEVAAFDVRTETAIGFRTGRVIFAAPQFLAPVLIRDVPESRRKAAAEFEYSPWLVANLHLRQRPAESGFPLAWDNVIYNSRSLGYVTATHQEGIDYGSTVLTWYDALCAEPARDARKRLLEMTWREAAEIVLSDLEQAHPEIRSLVERLDVMKWGHAMVRPRPGFVWGQARREASLPLGPIHFAGTDLSGIALCEEAVFHGVRAAEEVLRGLGRKFDTLL